MPNIANILNNILSDSGVDISTLVPSSRTLTINGTTFDLSANRSWTISSGLTASSPLSIASNVISISQANATTDGYLSSTDWSTFNAKQSPLSGIGFVKVNGSTISYDNSTYTPTSRLLTINGTSYDLSADRSWTITPGSGMRNVQTFIATSNQTTFTFTGGYTVGLIDVYVNGTRLSTSDYTATNGTTIVLGVGAITNDIVDIVSFTASLTSGITGSGTTNYISKWSGSSSLTNSLIFDNGTNVGIGTTSPTLSSSRSGLVVRGNANGAELLVQSTSATNGTSDGFVIATIANHAYLYNRLNGNLSIATNNLERILITSGGNVGINTASPSYKLQVTEGTWTGSNYTIYANGYSYFNGVRINGADTDRSIYQVNASSLGIATSGAYPILFFTNATSEVMRITSGGQLLVGVSSVVSNEKFRVIGSSNISGIARFENSQNQADLNHGVINIINTRTTYAIGNDASIMFSAYNSTLSMQPRASIGMKVSSDLGGDLVFNTRNNSSSGERMRIKESGVINFSNVPTSSAGLSSGDIYKSGSTLMIV
jgi:hypothetical protein